MTLGRSKYVADIREDVAGQLDSNLYDVRYSEVQLPETTSRKRRRVHRATEAYGNEKDELSSNIEAALESGFREDSKSIQAVPKGSFVKTRINSGQKNATKEDENGFVSPLTRKRIKASQNPYGLTPGESPFPEWISPTPEECEEVNSLLSRMHGDVVPPATIPAPSLTVSGCGEVPSVLDALIRTLLSGATSGSNSAKAFQGLVSRFGIVQSGVGKGSVDWEKVRQASVDEVYQAMKCGGLGQIKSKNIKKILQMVYEENMTRRESNSLHIEAQTNQQEGQKVDEPVLSLDHLHCLSKESAMLEFMKYPGIGVKTAACVVLFCLRRPCFAVDTHVFRISKWLGWIPSAKTNEISAFSHLEVRVPDHLKYPLHQLLIHHGKLCPRCRAISGEKSEGWNKGCVIEHLVKRTGTRKRIS